MILLKELTIKNFLSHEKTTIKFGENEKSLISGKSGSGKSSITEAILWAFYGKGRSDNRNLVRRGSKVASASLKLIDGELETLITRTVSSTGKNTLAVTQNTGSKGQFLSIDRIGLKDIQEWIEKDFLKASYELFTNSVAYPQENENSFVKATASKRKDLLLEIVRAGNFDDLYKKARESINANKIKDAGNVSKIETLEQDIKLFKSDSEILDMSQRVFDDCTLKIKGFKEQERDLETKLNSITGLSQKIIGKKDLNDLLTENIQNIVDQGKKDEETIKEHSELDVEKANENIEKAVKMQERMDEIGKILEENSIKQQKTNAHLANKPTFTDFEKDITTINNRLIPLLQESNSCPSGDKCPFVQPMKDQIVYLTGQIEEKTLINKNQKEALEFWEKEYALLVPLTDTTGLYEESNKLKGDIQDIFVESNAVITKNDMFQKILGEITERKAKAKTDTDRINSELVVVMGEITELEKEYKEFDSNNINLELSTVKVELEKHEVLMGEASNNIALATKAVESLKNALDTINELQTATSTSKEELESLELLKEALSPRGVKAVVIDYLVPQLEEKINEVLSQMSDFSIRLDTQQKKATGDDFKEGLFIKVVNDIGEEMDFSNYSGGERVKITIAISEALSSLQNSIGFRIMDENIISLDKDSTESFVEVLIKLQEKIPQLLLISHLQDIQDIFENKINVVKVSGISKIL